MRLGILRARLDEIARGNGRGLALALAEQPLDLAQRMFTDLRGVVHGTLRKRAIALLRTGSWR